VWRLRAFLSYNQSFNSKTGHFLQFKNALAFGYILQCWVGRTIGKTASVGTIYTAIQTAIQGGGARERVNHTGHARRSLVHFDHAAGIADADAVVERKTAVFGTIGVAQAVSIGGEGQRNTAFTRGFPPTCLGKKGYKGTKEQNYCVRICLYYPEGTYKKRQTVTNVLKKNYHRLFS